MTNTIVPGGAGAIGRLREWLDSEQFDYIILARSCCRCWSG